MIDIKDLRVGQTLYLVQKDTRVVCTKKNWIKASKELYEI